MRIKIKKRAQRLLRWNNKGVALILVLTSIAILSAFSAEFSYKARVDVHMATNLEREIQAYFHARSAVEIASLVINSQRFIDQAVGMFKQYVPNLANTNIEVWPFACKFVEVFNTRNLNFMGLDVFTLHDVKGIGVDKGGFSCEIEPEDAKINVNQIHSVSEKRALFVKLYSLFKNFEHSGIFGEEVDEREMVEIILNIMDWVDPDDAKTDIDMNGQFVEAGGAGENADYSKYDYKVKNSKFDTVEEIRLVHGITDDLFCNLSKFLTVYNTEKINVNEADIELIKALVCQNLSTDPLEVCGVRVGPLPPPIDIAAGFLQMCRNIKKALYSPTFVSTDDFINFFHRLPEPLNSIIKLNPSTISQLVGVRSRVLKIKAKGFVAGSEREIKAVIDTSSGRYLYWRELGTSL